MDILDVDIQFQILEVTSKSELAKVPNKIWNLWNFWNFQISKTPNVQMSKFPNLDLDIFFLRTLLLKRRNFQNSISDFGKRIFSVRSGVLLRTGL